MNILLSSLALGLLAAASGPPAHPVADTGDALLERASRRLDAAIGSLVSDARSLDIPQREVAWSTYLGELKRVEAELVGKVLDVRLRVHAVDRGRLVLESPTTAGGSLRFLVGRPVELARVGSLEAFDAEVEGFHAALDDSLLRGVMPRTPPQLGAAWMHVGEALTPPEFEALAKVGASFHARIRLDRMFVLSQNWQGDSAYCESVGDHASGGVERALAQYDNRPWGAWIVTGTWADGVPGSDVFGRSSPTMADFCTNDGITSDRSCRTLRAWGEDVSRVAGVLEHLRDSLTEGGHPYEGAGWSDRLSDLYRRALTRGPDREAARRELTPWLVWSADSELLGLLWPDHLRYTQDTFAPNAGPMTTTFWQEARRALPPDLAVLAVAAGGGEVLNVLTDDVVDPYVPSLQLEGLSVAHFAMAFGEPRVVEQLAAERFSRELRERVRYMESIPADDVPLSRAQDVWLGEWFDGRPAWLRDRYPRGNAQCDAAEVLEVQRGDSAGALGPGRFRIESVGAKREYEVLLERRRKQKQREDPFGYRELSERSRAGMAHEGRDGMFVFTENLGGGGSSVPEWSFEERAMCLSRPYGLGDLVVPIVPFAPDWSGMTPESSRGLTPADIGVLIHGSLAWSSAMANAAPTATTTALARDVFAARADAPEKVKRELEDAVLRFRRIRDWFVAARARRIEAPAGRAELVEVLQREWWEHPALHRDPANPLRLARKAEASRSTTREADPEAVRHLVDRRGSGQAATASAPVPDVTKRSVPPSEEGALEALAALLPVGATFRGNVYQGSAVHACTLHLALEDGFVVGTMLFDGKVLRASKRIDGSVALDGAGPAVLLALNEVELTSNDTNNAAFPLVYSVGLGPDGVVEGDWFTNGTRRGSVLLQAVEAESARPVQEPRVPVHLARLLEARPRYQGTIEVGASSREARLFLRLEDGKVRGRVLLEHERGTTLVSLSGDLDPQEGAPFAIELGVDTAEGAPHPAAGLRCRYLLELGPQRVVGKVVRLKQEVATLACDR